MAIDNTLSGTSANSYSSIADADNFFLGRLYSDLWNNADDTKKEQALRTATRRIDMETFYGEKTVSSQALKFPRSNLGYLDGIDLDGIIPKQVKEALYELAIYLLSTDMSKPTVDISNYKKVKVGSIQVDYAIEDNANTNPSTDALPPFVLSLLVDLSKTVSKGAIMDIGR